MRVLLTANASYDPPRGGSTRSNLAWLRRLAAAGHECHTITPTADAGPDRVSHLDGITIHGVRNLSLTPHALAVKIRELHPDWVLVSSEDLTHVLLREAGAAAPGRLIYLAHTPQFFPFGPESWHQDPRAAAILRDARAIVAIGCHMAGYIREHLGHEPAVIHPPIYGEPPWRRFGRFGSGYVLMINPCAVKGISIFLALAARFPDCEFAALNGWGTTSADRTSIECCPNARILENVPNIEEVLSEARLLLMPSLWYEGFGLIAMEAMLRGVPVVASDSGGLLEAKKGTRYIIPVRGVERYEPAFDETLMPRGVVPRQDITPWVAALETLLNEEDEYRAESERSRQAALAFVSAIDPLALEKLLFSLTPVPEKNPREKLRDLSPAARAALLAKLKNRPPHP